MLISLKIKKISLQNKSESELNEILFKKFSINYNNEPCVYKKGSIIYKVTLAKKKKKKKKNFI